MAKIKQVAIKETCVAGRTIEHVIKLPSGCHKGKRAQRMNATPENVKKINDIIAERNFRRLINHNFGYGSGHYTLTYGHDEPTPAEAKKHLKNFLNRLKYAMGDELKWIAVTEYENKRIHHHVIINTCDAALINKKWGKGWVKPTLFDDSGDYHLLANYLIKETQKTFRDEDCPTKRRYSCSRNLEKPIVKRESVSIAALFDDPKAIKGYYIAKDSIRRYTHPVTGLDYLEYTEIALDKPRRYKVWPRGKKVRAEGLIKIREREKQLGIAELG